MTEQRFCENGHPMDPSWDVCPYCRTVAMRKDAFGESHAKSEGSIARVGGIPHPEFLFGPKDDRKLVGWLYCSEGSRPQEGEDYRVTEGRTTLGTAADCDIVVFDQYVNAQHAAIIVESRQSTKLLLDHDTKNGTFVNDERITKVELADGDVIRIGQTMFLFKTPW